MQVRLVKRADAKKVQSPQEKPAAIGWSVKQAVAEKQAKAVNARGDSRKAWATLWQ